MVESFPGEDVKVLDRYYPVTLARPDLDLGLERRERDRRVRWVDDETRPAVDDRQILVLTIARRTAVATVLVAGDATPELPATGSLTEVSAERSHLAQGRRADDRTRLRQGCVSLTN